jgi:hypothetical protein
MMKPSAFLLKPAPIAIEAFPLPTYAEQLANEPDKGRIYRPYLIYLYETTSAPKSTTTHYWYVRRKAQARVWIHLLQVVEE